MAPAARGRARPWYRRPDGLLTLAIPVAVILGWEASVRVFKLPDYILPPPAEVLAALGRGMAAGFYEGYHVHIAYTLGEALAGFVIGSVVGVLVGTVLSQFQFIERASLPYIMAFQALPKVAIAPLFVVWFGFGVTSKVVIVSLLTFFPLLVNSMSGFHTVDRQVLDLMRSLVASRLEVFWKVKLPHALPFIFAGLEMALVYSLIGAIVGEFVGARHGLGVLILQMNSSMDVAGVFSVLVVLSVVGAALHVALTRIRRRVIFWVPRPDRAVGL
jgi:NitT/TauT family transport system permease protein